MSIGGIRRKVYRRRRPALGGLLLGLLGTGLAALPLQAQTPPDVPRVPTREEIERAPPTPPVQQAPRLTVEGGIERAPCALAGAAYRDISFDLKSVAFDDLRGLPPEALRSAYEPFLGQRHPIAVICEIRDRAATILRDAGYIAAVEIPEQRIADGDVRFQVLMAKLVSVRVRGDAGRSERTIAAYLEKLTGEEVFNRHDAERYLLLASDLPGYDVRLTLRSAEAGRGEVIGEVTVMRTPGRVDFNVQNYGSRGVGRWGGLLRGELYGLTGLGDRTTLAFFSTSDFSEQQTYQIGHDFRIGSEGLTLGGMLTYSEADPSLDDPALDVRAKTFLATAEAGYPFLRSQDANVRGAVGMEIINQRLNFGGLPLSRDRLRIAYARLDMDATDPASIGGLTGFSAIEPRWRAGASLELRQGLDIFDASEGCGPAFTRCIGPGAIPPSRLEGDPTGTLVRFEAQGEFRPALAITFALGMRAQYTGNPLFSFEEYSAGNYTIGRGYDPGTLLGDSGIGFQGEVRVGSLIPRRPDAISVQPYAFVDSAWIRNEDRFTVALGKRHLTSIGAGIRAAYGGLGRVDVLLAVPLNRAGLQTEKGDARILVSLSTNLWPWRF